MQTNFRLPKKGDDVFPGLPCHQRQPCVSFPKSLLLPRRRPIHYTLLPPWRWMSYTMGLETFPRIPTPGKCKHGSHVRRLPDTHPEPGSTRPVAWTLACTRTGKKLPPAVLSLHTPNCQQGCGTSTSSPCPSPSVGSLWDWKNLLFGKALSH